MISDPLVTVLMPVYNAGAFLRPTMETILGQTYRDFEFLIINDCSTDDSLETIRSFSDPRIRVHTNSVNMGQTKSLNVGLRLARGKYIVINDADDYSLPKRIETQLDFITKHPEYPVVGCSCNIMDREGKVRRTFHRPTDEREIMIQMLSETPMTHGAIMMDREFILSQGGYNEDFKICQDYELWSSIIRKGHRIANLPDILVTIRHFMDSLSFRERDTQLLDNARTIKANIEVLCGLEVTLENAIRQRVFFTAPESLTCEDFSAAESLFNEEYRCLRNRDAFGESFLSKNLARKLMKPFAKLAIAQSKSGRLRDARKTSLAYLKRYGFEIIPFVIWVSSFGHPRFLDLFLAVHEKLETHRAKPHADA
jgi:glycosyltransferase involved in cell wall biosynthesis